MQKIIIKILLKLLNAKGENKTFIISELLDKVDIIPIKSIVDFSPEGVKINGRILDFEQAQLLKDSTKSLKDNYARRVINEQLTYNAIQMGVHQGLNPEMIMFSKSILWLIQEENKLISKIDN